MYVFIQNDHLILVPVLGRR